ncbi:MULTISPECIES: hypothetical protein [unclassified Pseudomonas]|uniref:hypothetical protein n=1 Tax=unclassified Pseudomonas TaxID=196821 RepID=UPI000C869B62|nr:MULTISPECIES: hypothetical protein [unclassified Pseudomonas]PMV24995.1 hypothetical protein C1X17_08490 [Pseudomonas sp. FW305-3-2-15-C-TSA2]PMV28700.1 hypothetical protein C1X22_13695 [Pseudomonas sp. DP16D-L5]PMV38011.1 hypothetical protein C1X21_16035 [Pseudomonas sp. FW305-3-2-15-A-LB2]PMV48903.1 hypothetical protein C1X16_03740 [Pseudomonas sp. FW305-3-2-15-C-R2A1]PMV53481.1 hypothetical protein C1X18_06205 [Pseudomonas sp. FW305-3-2-15-C-LB1]
MSEAKFVTVEDGVLKVVDDTKKGPEEVLHSEVMYYRFMDYFYTQTKHLDQLTPEGVSNLCRARAKYPSLISKTNVEVRSLFKALAKTINPATLLEIGAGRNPVFEDEPPTKMHYVLSDADNEVVVFHSENNSECYAFSGEICNLPSREDYFEMVIAVFVLHFPFHKNQLVELYKRLSSSGVIIANVYRRSTEARESLISEITETGFKIKKIVDSAKLCRDHEYWILGKSYAQLENCAIILKKLINQPQRL